MNTCGSGHRRSSTYGKTPKTWAVCSVRRKKAAMARKATSTTLVRDLKKVLIPPYPPWPPSEAARGKTWHRYPASSGSQARPCSWNVASRQFPPSSQTNSLVAASVPTSFHDPPALSAIHAATAIRGRQNRIISTRCFLPSGSPPSCSDRRHPSPEDPSSSTSVRQGAHPERR
jgi:hypothetical protein